GFDERLGAAFDVEQGQSDEVRVVAAVRDHVDAAAVPMEARRLARLEDAARVERREAVVVDAEDLRLAAQRRAHREPKLAFEVEVPAADALRVLANQSPFAGRDRELI